MILSKQATLILLSLITIFILSAAPRLYKIGLQSPEPDELLWRARSQETLAKARQGRFTELTSHVKHPGAVPTLFMASAQYVGNQINTMRGVTIGQEHFLDTLESSRLATACLACLTPLLLFALVYLHTGLTWAFLTATLFALDPYFLSASRMAHLDATMTLFALATVLLYVLSIRKQSSALSLLAGVFWGLTLACKVTAVSILPICFIYKLIYRHYSRQSLAFNKLITWGDFWTALIGLLTLALVYQRLWILQVEKLGRLRFHNSFFAGVKHTSKFLLEHPLLTTGLAIILATSCLLLWRRVRKSGASSFPAHVLLLLTLLLPILTFYPHVFNNLIRLFLFTGSLKQETYSVDGLGLWLPPVFGYPEYFFRRLPTPILLATLASLVLLPLSLKRRFVDNRQLILWFASFLAVAIWLIPLSIPEKKVYRYALPILPYVYICAVCALQASLILLRPKLPALSRTFSATLLTLSALSLALYYFWILNASTPNYRLYANSISGGYRGFQESRLKMSPAGHESALDYLVLEYQLVKHDLSVGVVGEVVDLMSSEFERMHPELKDHILFFSSLDPQLIDYVLYVGDFPELTLQIEKNFRPVKLPQPLFSYDYDGVHLMRIYQTPYLPLAHTYDLKIDQLGHNTGLLAYSNKLKQTVINVSNKRHKPGHVLFYPGIRSSAGTYQVNISAQLLPEMPGTKIPHDAPILNVTFLDCHRSFTYQELSQAEARVLSLECSASRSRRLPVAAYWTGAASLLVTQVSINPG